MDLQGGAGRLGRARRTAAGRLRSRPESAMSGSRLRSPVVLLALSRALVQLFGLVPGFRASRTDPGVAMKTEGRGLTSNRDRLLVQRCLVTAQVAVSLVLLFGAALFVRSFRNLITLDTGLRRDGVMFAMFADFSDRPSPERVLAAQSVLLERIRSVPSVAPGAIT